MRRIGFKLTTFVLMLGSLTSAAKAELELDFIPATLAHRYAASAYAEIWAKRGADILAALERRSCLPFPEPRVAAVVADAPSNSGGPEVPMRLRATYPLPVKQATLVHELGHRHLWQLEKRLDHVDGHRTLFLVLDRVWADIWGEAFAEERVAGESAWQMRYDYAAAWAWVRALAPDERARLWNELLALNGFPDDCDGLADAVEEPYQSS
jgi:hypothetical protein